MNPNNLDQENPNNHMNKLYFSFMGDMGKEVRVTVPPKAYVHRKNRWY